MWDSLIKLLELYYSDKIYSMVDIKLLINLKFMLFDEMRQSGPNQIVT